MKDSASKLAVQTPGWTRDRSKLGYEGACGAMSPGREVFDKHATEAVK